METLEERIQFWKNSYSKTFSKIGKSMNVTSLNEVAQSLIGLLKNEALPKEIRKRWFYEVYYDFGEWALEVQNRYKKEGWKFNYTHPVFADMMEN